MKYCDTAVRSDSDYLRADSGIYVLTIVWGLYWNWYFGKASACAINCGDILILTYLVVFSVLCQVSVLTSKIF